MSDSSDNDHFTQDIEYTTFIEGKIRWWFDLLDVDKDGYISRDDFLIITSNYVKEYGCDENKAVQLRDELVSSWADLEGRGHDFDDVRQHLPLLVKMGQTLKTGGKISQDEFSLAIGQLVTDRLQMARSVLEQMVHAFFDIFDHDHDGYITRQEMVVAMRCFGLEEHGVVDVAFNCMDLDRDDRLSRAEYSRGWISFLLGQDKGHAFVIAFVPDLSDA